MDWALSAVLCARCGEAPVQTTILACNGMCVGSRHLYILRMCHDSFKWMKLRLGIQL